MKHNDQCKKCETFKQCGQDGCLNTDLKADCMKFKSKGNPLELKGFLTGIGASIPSKYNKKNKDLSAKSSFFLIIDGKRINIQKDETIMIQRFKK